MFWRLFATYVLLVAAAVACVGLLVLQRTDEEEFAGVLATVGSFAGGIVAFSALPAFVLARRFTTPIEELTNAAKRLTAGDFGFQVAVRGSSEITTLVETLNGLSARLARSFADLEQDKEQLRTILSGMVEGVVAFDADQRVLFANGRAGELLEFDPDQAVGRRLWEVTGQRAVQEAAAKGLTGAGPYRQELDHKGEKDRSLAVYVGRMPGPVTGPPSNGDPAPHGPPGAVLVLHDITDIRRLERLRQDFVANVSHELKTPLANIKSSVEVLLDGAAEEAATRNLFLAEIEVQADRLDHLVADLLSLARVESGETRLEFEAVHVEDAVHACLDRHRTRAEVKGLRLDGVALAGCPPELAVWADEEALAQILDNLVDNAIKYTPAQGRITCRWEANPQQVCVEVEDSGVGIPARDLPRVFERFYRVDKARGREMGGTGLGLAIVKHMVQAMQGTVRATSDIGRGTTFRVCLPRAGAAG